MMSANAHKEKDNAFEAFSRRLVPSAEYLDKGTAAAQTIFDRLKEFQEEKKPKTLFIDRVFVSGSIGKKTAISNSDFDCVIFVNIEKISEIAGVLDEFEKILLSSKPFHLGLTAFKKTRFSVQFKYKGIDFDVLPAINLINHEAEQKGDPERGAEMAFKVYEQLNKDPSLMYNYSSALVETTLRFMNEQGQGQDPSVALFIHDLVRLSKKFNKSIIIDELISGRSTLMEVMGVYAAREELKLAKQENRSPSLLKGFREFLNLLVAFPEVYIKFDDFDPLTPSRSSQDISWLQPEHNSVLKQTIANCYIMDPANPFNNLYKEVEYEQRRHFRHCARVGLARLDNFVQNWPSVSIDTIFSSFALQQPPKNKTKKSSRGQRYY